MNATIRNCAVFLAAMLCSMLAVADDIDLYLNPPANTVAPPATILVLDLNLLGLCDNPFTDGGSSSVPVYGSLNPLGAQACFNVNALTLTNYLMEVGANPTTLLTSALGLLGPSGLCALYSALGISGPIVPSGLLGLGLGNLGCSTLTALNGLVSPTVLANFVTTLEAGLTSTLLTTVMNQLPPALKAALSTAMAAASIPTLIVDISSYNNLMTLLGSILNNLINSRVAIVVSHSNRGSTTMVQPTDPPYVCSFADRASVPSARQSTVGCSNGGYFLVGFTSLVSSTTVTSLLNRVASLLSPVIPTVPPTAASEAAYLAHVQALINGISLNPGNLTPMFQEKENYDEIVHYLTSDALYNGALNSYDGLFGALPRDTSIESGSIPNATYVNPAVTCRNINVINIQATNDVGESDSDPDLARYFPTTTLTVTGQPQQGFANLVAAAQSPGFIDANNYHYSLNSIFLIQNTLSSVSALANTGATIETYASPAGLLGLGTTTSTFQTLVTDASLVSASQTSSTSALPNGTIPAFLSEFKPASNQQPDWSGNVKSLDLLSSGTSYTYVDAKGNPGIASDGRISPTALTIWTTSAGLGGAPYDGRTTTLGGAGENIPGYVNSGGGNPGRYNAAGIRQMFYDSTPSSTAVPSLQALDADAPSTSATPFNSSTNTELTELASSLNCTVPASTSDSSCQQLLLYARGFSVGTTAAPASNLSTVTSRSWMEGAVLHSRPAALSFGARSGYSAANPDVRVLYGSADGLLHMVRNTGTGGAASGSEVWSFMPKAVMNFVKTQRDNGYSSPSNLGFPYGVDGAVSILAIDRGKPSGSTCPSSPPPADGIIDSSNPCDHAYAFFGLRRGGSNYYGINITNPDSPTLMWRIGTDGLYSATAGTQGLVNSSWFKEMGQSFSTPVVGKMYVQLPSDAAPTAHSVLIFGGGYNGSVNGTKIGKDLNNSRANGTTVPQVGQNDSTGNAIYIVDATTGQLIWKAVQGSSAAYTASSLSFTHPLLQDSIPSDITAVDTDGDGYIDRLYVGDTGGHVWRGDFPVPTGTTTGDNRPNWTLSLLASLGRHATSTATMVTNTLANDRRFLEAPDYVPVRNPGTLTAYDDVIIGSGDREDPFNTNDPRSNGTNNYLFALRDPNTASGKKLSDATTQNRIIVSESDTYLISNSPTGAQTPLTTLAACPENSSSCASTSISNSGWQLAYLDYGEKTTSAPITTGGIVVLTTFVPPPIVTASTATCGPTEGFSKIYGLVLDTGNFYSPLQFNADGNGDARSMVAAAPGMAGEVAALGIGSLNTNAQPLSVTATNFFRVFWREMRGDEEIPPVQPVP